MILFKIKSCKRPSILIIEKVYKFVHHEFVLLFIFVFTNGITQKETLLPQFQR